MACCTCWRGPRKTKDTGICMANSCFYFCPTESRPFWRLKIKPRTNKGKLSTTPTSRRSSHMTCRVLYTSEILQSHAQGLYFYPNPPPCDSLSMQVLMGKLLQDTQLGPMPHKLYLQLASLALMDQMIVTKGSEHICPKLLNQQLFIMLQRLD